MKRCVSTFSITAMCTNSIEDTLHNGNYILRYEIFILHNNFEQIISYSLRSGILNIERTRVHSKLISPTNQQIKLRSIVQNVHVTV